jgi:hypothetical protein
VQRDTIALLIEVTAEHDPHFPAIMRIQGRARAAGLRGQIAAIDADGGNAVPPPRVRAPTYSSACSSLAAMRKRHACGMRRTKSSNTAISFMPSSK